MEPQIGDIWMWFGGQHYLVIEFNGMNSRDDKLWTVIELLNGKIDEMSFRQHFINDGSWKKVA